MKIEKARELIKEYTEYVAAYELYEPETMKEHAVKLYAFFGSVSLVAEEMNNMGYKKQGKLVAGKRAQVKLTSNDVTKLLDSDIEDGDPLHPFVKRALNKNRRRKGIVT